AEDGIRVPLVTGVQTCALPILKTTVLPHTSAGTIFHDGIAIGKFQGVITAHTPSGCRTDIANLSRSSEGTVCPYRRLPSPAMKKIGRASCRQNVPAAVEDRGRT